MKGKTHIGIGVLAFLSIYKIIPGGFSYIGLAITAFSSALPDVDHPKSIINKYILPFRNKMTKVTVYGCLGIILLWYDYLYLNRPIVKAIGIALILIAVSSHRNGLTHSLTGMSMFSFIAGYIGNMYNIPYLIYYFMIGYGMHLICDMCTDRGIPLFYPFRNKKVKFPFTYKTNSKIGSAIEQLLMIGGLLFTIYKIPSIFYK